MKKHPLPTPVSTPKAPAAIGPYSQGIKSGQLLFISGQLPIDPQTGDFTDGDIREKTHQALRNVQAVAQVAGADLKHVIKTTVFLKDMKDFPAVNEAYAQHFGQYPPARSAVEVSALPKDAQIEIEAVVHLPKD